MISGWLRGLLRRKEVYDEMADVRRFNERFGFPTPARPKHIGSSLAKERIHHLREEVDELDEAFDKQALTDIADALVDIVYVAKVTAAMLGLPWDAMWEEVQRANLDKVPGITKRGFARDAVKPPGWIEPQHELILEAAGYDRDQWFDKNNYFTPERDDDHEA